jgi:hypothetical protein
MPTKEKEMIKNGKVSAALRGNKNAAGPHKKKGGKGGMRTALIGNLASGGLPLGSFMGGAISANRASNEKTATEGRRILDRHRKTTTAVGAVSGGYMGAQAGGLLGFKSGLKQHGVAGAAVRGVIGAVLGGVGGALAGGSLNYNASRLGESMVNKKLKKKR